MNPRYGDPVGIHSINNVGWVIARTDEIKQVEIEWRGNSIVDHNVTVLSSNYTLYGDMSRRLTELTRIIHQEI